MRYLIVIIILMLSPVSYIFGSGHEATVLPEVLVVSGHKKLLHLLAYVREYSTMTTYTDTVFLFREKMVDYMLPAGKVDFKGWSTPRVLTSRSYYRFSNSHGLRSSDLMATSPIPAGTRISSYTLRTPSPIALISLGS